MHNNFIDSSIITHSVSSSVFEPNTKQQVVIFQTSPDVYLNDTVLKFKIKIANVTVKGFGKVNVDTGEPVTVTVYDNSCKYIISRSKQ